MQKYFQRLVLGLLLCFVLPHPSRGAGGSLGNDNPTGPTGDYNGGITTGGSYDPYTGNAKRIVTDLTVTGSLGAYPLKWTRILNTRAGSAGTSANGFARGPWRHSYNWGLWLRQYRSYEHYPDQYTGPSGILHYPDGRRMEFDVDQANNYTKRSSEPGDLLVPAPGLPYGHYDLLLADGGRVEFRFDTPPPFETSYNLRATRIVDPHGLATELLHEENRLSEIIEPGGRYLKIEYETYTVPVPPVWGGGEHHTTVIRQVKAFAGPGRPETETVTYHYVEKVSPDGLRSYELGRVAYADGAEALYTYFPVQAIPPPGTTPPPQFAYSGRIQTCHDPRFAGPMGKIEYDYLLRTENNNRDVVVGQIQGEKYPGASTFVSEVEYPEDLPMPAPHVRKEKRPDDQTRSFQYSNDGKGELLSYTDFKGQPTLIEWPEWENYTRSVRDARGNTTVVEREWSVGAVKKITYPREPDEPNESDRKYVLFEHSDPNNPYYVASKTDERGKVTSYTRYPGDGQFNKHMVQHIDYPDGGRESFTYNRFNQVLEHWMTSGGKEEFRYDERGLKTLSWPPATSSDNDPPPQEHPTRYFYYQSGIHTDRLHHVIDPRGKATWYEYNGRGQVTKVFHADNTVTESFYKPDGTLEWTKDELGHMTAFYQYDEYKRVTRVTNHLSQSVTNSYAPWNGRGPLSHTTSSVYRTTTHLGKKTDHEYDENFRRKWTKQAPESDDWALTEFTYDRIGNLETVKDPRGTITSYGYDGRNRQIWVRNDELNETTEFRYDPAGNKIWEKRPDDVFRSWDYDEMNRVAHAYDWRTNETPTARQTTTYLRDDAGNARTITDTKGAEYHYVYDDLNRKESATYPTDANGQVRTETWHYDRAGNLDLYTNPAGQKKHIEYDDRNRAWHSWWEGGAAVGQEIVTDYDLAGRVEWIETRANGNMVTRVAFGYDAANRKIWEDQTVAGHPTRRVKTDPDADGRRERLEIVAPAQEGGNAPGVLIASPEMAGSGQYSVTYSYTERNQLRTISGNAQADEDWTFNYTYDRSGNMIARRADYNNLSSTTQCPGENCYDALNRPLRWDQSGPGGFHALSHYRYDRANREEATWRQEDDNRGEHFVYEVTNQLKRVSYNGAIPPPSPTPTPTAPPTPPPGQTPTPTPPPGEQVEDVGFSQSGQPPNILLALNTNTGGAIIFCTMSSEGYVPPTHSNETATGNTFVYHGPISVPAGEWYFMAIAYKAGMIDSAVTEWMVYNGEMVPGAQQRVVNYTYSTDKLNRISLHDTAAPVQTASYTPNALNQYTNVGGASYNYDAKFNLTWAAGFSAAYDAANRMVSASNASMAVNAEVELVYDGLGRCVKRTIDNVTTIIIYDDWKPIAEWDGWTEDYFQAWNVYGPGADEILLRHEAKMGYIRYHSDPHGNVNFLLDNDGVVVQKYTYDVFGRPKIMGPGGAERASCHYNNRFLFQGREYIDEIGVYDYRNRFYHPDLGRFLQVDPTGFDAGDMNLFRFCGDDPIDGSDPTGLTAFLPDRIWEMARYMDSSNMTQGLFQEQMLRRFPAGMDGDDGGGGSGKSKSVSSENEGEKKLMPLPADLLARMYATHLQNVEEANDKSNWTSIPGTNKRVQEEYATGIYRKGNALVQDGPNKGWHEGIKPMSETFRKEWRGGGTRAAGTHVHVTGNGRHLPFDQAQAIKYRYISGTGSASAPGRLDIFVPYQSGRGGQYFHTEDGVHKYPGH
jgi:RHS repeat-associated protein